MRSGPLAKQIIGAFDSMPAQIQAAARYVLDNPYDVALLTMREQARQAGIQPATMTRLAKHLGLDGYEEIRRTYAGALRGVGDGFASKAGAQAKSQRLKGDHALAAESLTAAARQIAALAEPAALGSLVTAARRLADARRVYCLGLRSSHSVAWHLHYILSIIGDKSVILDGIAGVGTDPIVGATEKDLLIAVSVLPYTRMTVEIADYAARQGVPVVALTDSPVAPLAQFAANTIVISTDSPSFLHSMASAFVVAEVLGALVAGRAGDAAVEALSRFDRQMAALNTHLRPRRRP